MILVRVDLEVIRAGMLALDPLELFTKSSDAVASIKLTYSRLPEVSFKKYPDKVEVTFNYSTGSPQGFLRPIKRPNFGYLTLRLSPVQVYEGLKLCEGLSASQSAP